MKYTSAILSSEGRSVATGLNKTVFNLLFEIDIQFYLGFPTINLLDV